MSAANANAAKPPRPCTEYNIFFQLERAYILQVLLRTPPSPDDPSDAFDPSQPSYAGLPPLPPRYAGLALPYDWHLPGKEKRRRRKHRKSHGAIGFHELSGRIVDAWRDVDGDVKAYCRAVCDAGMRRYKQEMKEWKRRQPTTQPTPPTARPPKTDRPTAAAKPEKIDSGGDEIVVPREIVVPVADAAGGVEDALQALLDDLDFPNEALSPPEAAEEMDRAFANDLPLMWDEPAVPLAAPSAVPSAVPSSGAVLKSRRTSVDMDDREIFALWSSENAVGRRHGNDGTPVACANDGKFDLKFNSMLGSDGYVQTTQDVQRMKELLDLEAQIAKLQRMKGHPRPRRCSVVACSA